VIKTLIVLTVIAVYIYFAVLKIDATYISSWLWLLISAYFFWSAELPLTSSVLTQPPLQCACKTAEPSDAKKHKEVEEEDEEDSEFGSDAPIKSNDATPSYRSMDHAAPERIAVPDQYNEQHPSLQANAQPSNFVDYRLSVYRRYVTKLITPPPVPQLVEDEPEDEERSWANRQCR
jgi:hypothetical protein